MLHVHTEPSHDRLRATPDQRGLARTRLWSVLANSGVDHLDTDDLVGLSQFLTVRGAA